MSQILCPLSGELLQKSDLLLGFDFQDLHPIFKAKKSIILKTDTVFRFHDATSWREKRLWWLAVLNTFDLVEFQVPPEPEPYIIEYTFADLITLATWVDYARHGIPERIAFPRYIVNRETVKMTNISSWVSAIYDIKKIFQQKDKENASKLEFNNRSQEMENEFRKASLTGLAFTRPLAKWALELTDCPESDFAEWLTILQTPLNEAWCLDYHKVKEIQMFLQEELPTNNDQALAVKHQIRKLREACTTGFTSVDPDDLDNGEEFSDEIVKPITKAPRPKVPEFELVFNEEDIPPEPKLINFTKKFEYIAAKAKWDMLVEEIKGLGRKTEYKQF